MKLLLPLIFVSRIAFCLPVQTQLIDMQEKPVAIKPAKKELVLFWASWCIECIDHLKNVIPEMSAKYPIYSINVDANIKRAKQCIEEEKIKLPIYRERSKYLQKELKAFAVPVWAVYDGEKLIDTASGFNQSRIEKALK
jgi:thiol-disulfide isomerase/thioredoxin